MDSAERQGLAVGSIPDGPVLLEVGDLAPEVLRALQIAAAGGEIMLVDAGRPIGLLQLRLVRSAAAQEAFESGTVPRPGPGPVTVVATAMALSNAARRRLSDELGDDFIVVDFTKAPNSAEVLLAPAVSPQLLSYFRAQFPEARIIVTEIEDDELGVSYSGPVSRLLEAGASAYLPPRPVAAVAAGLRSHLAREAQPAVDAAHRVTDALTAAPEPASE